jgi:hypothetical protein
MTMALPRRRTMLLESIGDPSLTAQAGFTVMCVKGQTGELLDVLRWSEATIEWADGDPAKGALLVGSPLAAALGYRATARWWFGRRGWREVLDDVFAIARNADAMTLAFVYSWNTVRILNGVLRADDAAVENLEAALRIGEASGDDYPVEMVKIALGSVLLFRDTAAERDRGLELLALGHDMCPHLRFPLSELPMINLLAASKQARRGDRDSAVPVMRNSVDDVFTRGQSCTAVKRRLFSWRRCSTVALTATPTKPKQRSPGWQRNHPTGQLFVTSGSARARADGAGT